ncbi:MAG: hypothetical protein BAJALOKI3v1_50129 [Promethearchaeota archaeon]|nr:MAG: hypothetical protein BAJALOKI3v1_50129 [Candidatus Lokiarchaeota archaeon]
MPSKYENEEMKAKYLERLKKIMNKKFETVIIHPLSEFEQYFGFIWGHGKTDDKLTDNEREMRKRWQECRANILNYGHRKRSNAMKELDMHTVVWNRYQTVFKFDQG